jgi:3-phenylpropionate/trans-cinnamate dioxygenase ferredoxin subunit
MPQSGAFRAICPSDAVADGFVVPHYLSDHKLRIALAHVGGQFYAFDDLCTCAPARCSLSSGLLTGTTIMCQCHGSQFDIATGAVINGPAMDPLKWYETHELEGTIRIRLDPTNAPDRPELF